MSGEGESLNLKSWVRTLNESEGMALLDLARPGQRLDIWRYEADQALTQDDANYRSLLIKMVERMLLDHDEERILDSRYLYHFQHGWEDQRMALFLIRYGLAHPWTALAGHKMLAPALRAAQRRDAPPEADQIELSVWDEFVDAHIDPTVGASSRKKTRSTIVGLFRKMGILEPVGTSSRAPLRVLPLLPPPMVFGWALSEQLRSTPERLITEQWASEASHAAAIFNPPLEYARRCVEAALQDGMLVRAPLSIHLRLAS